MSTTLKKTSVLKVKAGDRINTTTGVRTVKRVADHGAFVAVYVEDPANPPKFETVLDYHSAASVTVVRGKGPA